LQELLQQLANGVVLGALYGLIALGYTMVYGIIQLINFAHGEIFMVGAFGSLFTWTYVLNKSTSVWAIPAMLIGGVIASVVVAVLMERFAYRPLRNNPKLFETERVADDGYAVARDGFDVDMSAETTEAVAQDR